MLSFHSIISHIVECYELITLILFTTLHLYVINKHRLPSVT